MTELLSTKTASLKSEQDVVVGVLACCPSYFGITASELADFGRDLKGAFPQFEFWVALADGGKDPPSFVLPATADYLVIDALDCGTRHVNGGRGASGPSGLPKRRDGASSCAGIVGKETAPASWRPANPTRSAMR